MADILPALITLAGFAFVLGGLVWFSRRARRHGGGGAIMGPFEQMWHPAATRAHAEVHSQEERPAPAPVPGDRLF